MNSDKFLNKFTYLILCVFVAVVCYGFYKQYEANQNLNDKIFRLEKQNAEITEQVDKLSKKIDAEIAKNLKEVADRNNVGG
ncbi:hypothetical protein [Streptococcus gordonii]|uniref:hypothetical protein n=1 Tax=Streptococcus gordonii TaxID=1302 RepID=UPI001D0775E3|nr:hypothetical protein [Streptococcus gordonii]MCB6407380.1 hypothetical protein [Streptococcus gordonii]